MIEDNKPSDICFASTHTNPYGASRNVKLFASLTDPGTEGTGIYISPTDPQTLYVNIQHSEAEDGDGTWAISRRWKGKASRLGDMSRPCMRKTDRNGWRSGLLSIRNYC
jgi:secreted PhoX family phosphatase